MVQILGHPEKSITMGQEGGEQEGERVMSGGEAGGKGGNALRELSLLKTTVIVGLLGRRAKMFGFLYH